MFSRHLFGFLAFIAACYAQSTHVNSTFVPMPTLTSTPRPPLIYSTSTSFSTSVGFENFITVVNGHTVDFISSIGGNTVVTVVEDTQGKKTTIAGQVYTVATGDISTVVAVPAATKTSNAVSRFLKNESLPLIATAIIGLAMFL